MKSFASCATLSLLLLLAWGQSVAADCSVECYHGTCLGNLCTCLLFYDGSACDSYWGDDTTWLAWFLVKRVVTIVVMSVASVFAVYQLALIFWYAKQHGKRAFTVITWVILACLLGTIARIIYYAVDPGGFFGIYPNWAASLVDDVAVLAWVNGGFLLLLYWFELQNNSGVQQLQGLRRMRPALLITIAISLLCLIPTGIAHALAGDGPGRWLYNAFVGVFLVCLIFICIRWGRRLLIIIGSLPDAQKNEAFRDFMKRITYFLFGVNAFMIMIIITLAIFTVFRRNRWSWVFANMVLRVLECCCVMCMLLVVQKKKPGKGDSASGSSTRAGSRKSGGRKEDSRSVELPSNKSGSEGKSSHSSGDDALALSQTAEKKEGEKDAEKGGESEGEEAEEKE